MYAEQDWITNYANDPANGMSLQFIGTKFNSCVGQTNDQVILHFCGSENKAALAAPFAGSAEMVARETPDCWPLSIADSTRLALLPRKGLPSSAYNPVCGRQRYILGFVEFQNILSQHIDGCFANAGEHSCSATDGCTWYSTFCATTAGDDAATVLSDIGASGNPKRLFSNSVNDLDERRTCEIRRVLGKEAVDICKSRR